MYTYNYLTTLLGAVSATILIVEFLKETKLFKNLPTRRLTFFVATGIIILTSLLTGEFTITELPLYVLNGLLVTSSAMGSWEVFKNKLSNPQGKNILKIHKGGL
ncbi:MAG: hypothetical protein KGZ94_00055 [Clostridia bacterium]|nr:hypothetical protein [Clostridia bacterium]